MEAEGPRGKEGAGVRLEPKTSDKSVVDSKLVANLGPLTDEKDAFRQWDEKMVNVLTHLRKGYGPALASIKDLVDRGRDPEDARRGMSSDNLESTLGPKLADTIRAHKRARKWDVDIDQLDSDLSFILVDKAKLKSEILNRIQNLKAQGGIKMYAEVYRWFTETSGLGLMGQAAKLMDPNAAAKEADVAEAIEQWEEKVNRLARHGEEYQLYECFKKVGRKKILVGKILDHFELLHL